MYGINQSLIQPLWCLGWNPVAICLLFWRFDVLACLRCFPTDLFEGCTHEVVVPLFLVILPSQTLGKASDLTDFRWTRVLHVLPLDFRFLMIGTELGLDLWARGCPWGVLTIPKVWFWSVERIGRSGDLIEGVDSLFLFISRFSRGGGLTAPGRRSNRP